MIKKSDYLLKTGSLAGFFIPDGCQKILACKPVKIKSDKPISI